MGLQIYDNERSMMLQTAAMCTLARLGSITLKLAKCTAVYISYLRKDSICQAHVSMAKDARSGRAYSERLVLSAQALTVSLTCTVSCTFPRLPGDNG